VPESFKASTGTFIFLNDLFQLFLVGTSRHFVFCHGRFLDTQKKKPGNMLLSGEQKKLVGEGTARLLRVRVKPM
jgi:hypothetical protein